MATKFTARPAQYVAIRLWGAQLGSYEYYVAAEQDKAARMGAPLDALYERNGEWVCVSDLKPDHHFHKAYQDVLAGRRPMPHVAHP